MTDQIEGVMCPWNILKRICSKHNEMLASAHIYKTVPIFEANERTITIILTIIGSRRQAGRASMKYATPTVRIERWSLLPDKESLGIFDAIYAATRKDRASAEIMLQMLSTSMAPL